MAGPYVNPSLIFEPGRMMAVTNAANAGADYSRALASQIPYARAREEAELARRMDAERVAGEAIMRMMRGGLGGGMPAGPMPGPMPMMPSPPMTEGPQPPAPGQPSVPMMPPPSPIFSPVSNPMQPGPQIGGQPGSMNIPIPPAVQAQRDADARRLMSMEQQPGGGPGAIQTAQFLNGGGGAPQTPAAPGGPTPAMPPPPYQTVESAAQARPPVAPAAAPSIGQPPVMSFDRASEALISQGLQGGDLWRALNKMAPMMDQQFQQHVKLLNQEIAFLKSQQAAADKRDDRAVRREAIEQRADAAAQRAEAAAARANALPRPKPGYMWNADGTEQVMIKGGPAWQKAKDVLDKDTKNQKLLDSFIESEIRNIDKLIGVPDTGKGERGKPHPGLAAATGSIDPYFPTLMTDTRNAEELIKSLQSKASISSLQTIRGTAGAIGTMTEREWPRLENMKATLSQFQGTKQFIDEAKSYRRELLRIKQAAERDMQTAHSEFYGAQPASSGGGAQAAPASAPAADERKVIGGKSYVKRGGQWFEE